MDVRQLTQVISDFEKSEVRWGQLIDDKSELITRIAELDHYLQHQDAVTETLVEIQKRMSHDTIAQYEAMLTELLRMVMPEGSANDEVVMSHVVKNNTVTLQTSIRNKEGYLHDIFEDKGMSVENVLALCLRFLALGRTSNRRLLMFDESDHGIMPASMPLFADVIHQLTYRIGMQVIYISHHDWRVFQGKARIIELSESDDGIQANILSEPDENHGVTMDDPGLTSFMEGVGIRHVHLKNFKAHTDTKIDLCPFMNVLIGRMDLGKSTVIKAINAVKTNKGRVQQIRDGQRSLSVELGLEGGNTLTWSYSKDSSKKAKYVLHDDEGDTLERSEGSALPEFLDSYLAMSPHRGYDLHISSQRDSGFVFSEGISGARAAEILSFDEDTSHAQEMLARHRSNVKLYKAELKTSKAKLNKVKNQLSICSRLSDVDVDSLKMARETLLADMSGDANQQHDLSVKYAHGKHASQAAAVLINSERKLEILGQLRSIEPSPVRPEGLSDPHRAKGAAALIEKSEERLKVLGRLKSIDKPPERPPVSLEASRMAHDLIQQRKSLEVLSRLKSLESLPAKPVVNDGASKALVAIAELTGKAKQLKDQATSLRAEQSRIQSIIQSKISESGGVCPLCKHHHQSVS